MSYNETTEIVPNCPTCKSNEKVEYCGYYWDYGHDIAYLRFYCPVCEEHFKVSNEDDS